MTIYGFAAKLELLEAGVLQGLLRNFENMFLEKTDLYFIFQVMEITEDYAFQMQQFPFRASLNLSKRSKRKVRSLLWIVVILGTSV